MITFQKILGFALIMALFLSCGNKNNVQRAQEVEAEEDKADVIELSAFDIEVNAILQTDPYLWILVDKENALSADYAPSDLVELKGGSYKIGRSGLMLRSAAAESLEEMSAAGKAQGLSLTASSTYRSYSYQTQVYERNVNQMGREATDRVSARPGHSQHQLGLVVDFGSITNDFAKTPEGIWLAANASRFGWSLSYPDGYEEITGYSWESWHFRYVGRDLARFIDVHFNGIQQHALKYLHERAKERN